MTTEVTRGAALAFVHPDWVMPRAAPRQIIEGINTLGSDDRVEINILPSHQPATVRLRPDVIHSWKG